MIKTIARVGSLVIIEDRNGDMWLTKRVKLRRNQRRQRIIINGRSVRHFPIIKLT